MPIYEFRCVKCGHIQEVLVSVGGSDGVEMSCNACKGEVLERVLSRVSYTMGSDKGATPRVSSKNCGSGNSCTTIDLPGHSR